MNALSISMLYNTIGKEYNNSLGGLSLIFLTLLNIYFAQSLSIMTTILNLLASTSIYITTKFDPIAIYRKKNYIFMSIIGIILGIAFYIYPISILIVPFIISIVSRKKGLKSSLRLSTATIITYILTIIFLYYMDFKIINTNYNLDYNYYEAYLYLIFIIISIFGSIYTLYKSERKMGYICRGIIVLSLLTIIFKKIEFSYLYLSVFYPVYLFLLIHIFDNVPQLYTKKIKTYKTRKSYTIDSAKKICAIIPNYNYENYISERIDSILFQTYKVSELIVLDDCSTDNSVALIENKLKTVEKKYPDIKIKFIKNNKNSGNVFKQWKKCFEETSCEYLWICEADDSASPYFLENVMKGFNHKKVIISYCESLTMDENDKLLMPDLREWIDIYKCNKWNKSYVIPGEEELKTTMCINNTIANVSSVVFKVCKDIDYNKYLKVAEEFKLAGDWYFYAKVLKHGDIAYCKKSLNYHRMHSKSVTLTTKGDMHFKEICRVQDMIMNDYKLSDEVKSLILDRRKNVQIQYNLGKEELRLLDIDFNKILNNSKVKDDILLSIIIPVYNTEPYLRKCLDSTLVNLPPKSEILIINDGSPDQSDKIGSEYEKKYNGIIKQYKKENGGLSSAKNYGLKRAKGRYIIYLDSDDYVDPNMYMTMLKKALETDADIVYCDIFQEYEDERREFFSMTNFEHDNDLMRIVDIPLMATSCNKMVKKELFKGLMYPEGFNNEDVAISPVLFVRAKKIEKVDSPFYIYLQRSGSIQNSGFSKKRFVIFDTAQMCFDNLFKEKIDKKDIDIIKGSIYSHQILGILLFIITRLTRKERLKYISLFCDKMNEFDDYATNYYLLEYLKKYHLHKLIGYIKNKEVNKIDLYLQIKMMI